MRTWTTFPDCVKKRLFCTCAMIVHTLVDQFLLQLLMDSLLLCFHITGTLVICIKKFDAEKIFFYKMASL